MTWPVIKSAPGRGVEGDQRRDRLGLGQPAEGDVAGDLLERFGVGEQFRRKIGRALDEVRGDGVDLDLERRQLPGQRDGQGIGTAASGRVNRVVGEPAQGRRRGDKQQLAAAPLLHLRHHRLGEGEGRGHQRLQPGAHILDTGVLDRRADRRKRIVVDQHVDPVVGGGDRGDDVGRLLLGDDKQVGMGRRELLSRVGEGEAGVVADDDGPLGGQLDRRRQPDEVRDIGDQRHPPAQWSRLAAHSRSPRNCCSTQPVSHAPSEDGNSNRDREPPNRLGIVPGHTTRPPDMDYRSRRARPRLRPQAEWRRAW